MTSKRHDQPKGVGVLLGRKFTPECPLQHRDLTQLKTGIHKGLADIAAGRIKDFDADRIIERGRMILTNR
jgi:antitoxin ParD1/3/4